MATPEPTPEINPEMLKAQELVRDVLTKNGARHSREITDALAHHLMGGGKPEPYGERLAQMQLQMEGLLPTKD